MDCSLPGSFIHEFSRQEYWIELPFPSPGDLPNLGMEPRFPALQADALLFEAPGKPIWAAKLWFKYSFKDFINIYAFSFSSETSYLGILYN